LKISRGEAVSTDGESVKLPGSDISIKIPTYKRPNVRKNVSGFYNARPLDAIDLFIGSEGLLGVITEIELSLLPKRDGSFSGIVFFEKETDLLGFVDEVRNLSFESRRGSLDFGLRNADLGFGLRVTANPQSDIPDPESGRPVATAPGSDLDATLLEYFDSQALKFITEKFPETPTGMAGAIFFEQETNAENEGRCIRRMERPPRKTSRRHRSLMVRDQRSGPRKDARVSTCFAGFSKRVHREAQTEKGRHGHGRAG
jgi:D-lactate dehydrogenase (cytochrome)